MKHQNAQLWSQPLRVGVLAPYLDPSAGGVAVSIRRLSEAVCHADPEILLNVFGLRRGSCLGACNNETGSAARVKMSAVLGPRTIGFSPSMMVDCAIFRPDLLHLQGGLWFLPAIASLVLSVKRNIPFILSPRGMLDPWALGFRANKKALARRLFVDRLLHRAVCLHATSEREVKQIRNLGLRQPVAVVENGVDLPAYRPKTASGAGLRLLFLSRLHPKKGLRDLLIAWKQIFNRFPHWNLIIAGPDEAGYGNEMRGFSLSLGLERISWCGPVFGQQKDDLFRSADLFVLPTLGENFGIVVAEALTFGIPVITTEAAPWEGLVRERCGWWSANNVDALRSSLEEAMSLRESEREQMGNRGRNWMERDFSWSNKGRLMSTVYRWISAGGRAPECVWMG